MTTWNKLSVGLEVSGLPNLVETLDQWVGIDWAQAIDAGFEFLAAPMFHPRLRRDAAGISDKRDGACTRSDMVMDSERWTTSVVGKLSPWIRLDAEDESTRKASVKAFKKEMAWASHLSVPAVLCPVPEFECFNYAHTINQTAQAGQMHMWVRVPLSREEEPLVGASGAGLGTAAAPPREDDGVTSGTGSIGLGGAGTQGDIELSSAGVPLARQESPRRDPWEGWRTLHSLAGFHPHISVCLEFTENLPPQEELDRWLGEPVKAAILPTSVFMTNRKGFPILSPRHQEFFQGLFKQRCQFLLRGRPQHETGFRPYFQYLIHLVRRMAEPTEKDQFEMPYYDYLQAPLQPLMDNLESQTYETFETDPIKYQQYEEAITAALADTPVDKTSVLMVVGAGRGPLVHRSIVAAGRADRRIRVFAVEKNPNAVITLRNRVLSEGWSDRVTVVSSDMRAWEAPEKADILVSELLGSFADNELSPECLDGAQRFLKDDGISIPYEYTSFAAPVTSSKLWNEVKAFKEDKYYETAFVVKLHNHKRLARAAPCMTFVHPNALRSRGTEVGEAGGLADGAIDNRRYSRMRFESDVTAVLHGFGGYFEAKLYKDIIISIHPETHSPGMFSWFPVYFPIKNPMYVRKGQAIDIHLWRDVTSKKVWYEWAVGSPEVSEIHNPGGRSYWIGL